MRVNVHYFINKIKMLITFLYKLFGLIVIGRLTESYKVYLVNKRGRLLPVDGVLHLDVTDTSDAMRHRLTKQLNDFLREPNTDTLADTSQKRSKGEYEYRPTYNRSPVVYSNGRYTLDLDKIDVRNINEVTNKPELDKEYFDPAESFRDYYDYIGISDRLRSITDNKIPWEQLKGLSTYLRNKRSLRKYNLLIGDKRFRAQDRPLAEYHYAIKLLREKEWPHTKKRFAIIKNNAPSTMKEKNRHRDEAISDYVDIQNNLSNENSESETIEYDDGVYLQGNTVVQLGGKTEENHKRKENYQNEDNDKGEENDKSEQNDKSADSDKSDKSDKSNESDVDENERDDEEEDTRKRLQHFMPKRYHWNAEDTKKLGYFWYNGPKGKYSDAMVAAN